MRQKRVDEECHLQGLYVYQALCNVSPVLHAFAKKGAKPIPYPTEPYSVKVEREERVKNDEEMQSRIRENERLKAILFFRQWARDVKNNFENKNLKK